MKVNLHLDFWVDFDKMPHNKLNKIKAHGIGNNTECGEQVNCEYGRVCNIL